MILVLACRHQMRHRQLDETVRLIIYTLDNSAPLADTAHNPLGQTLCLIDLSGLSSALAAGMVLSTIKSLLTWVNHVHGSTEEMQATSALESA